MGSLSTTLPLGYRSLPRLRRARKLHKTLHQRLRLPRRIATDSVALLAFLRSPVQYFVRRNAARMLARSASARAIPENAGYLLFGPDDLPAVRPTVQECLRALDDFRVARARDAIAADDDKEFQVHLLRGTQVSNYPAILDFAVSRPVLERVSGYLGRLPLLCNAQLYLTFPNSSVEQSQKYHFDFDGHRQIKLFVNIFATAADQGPFTLLSADASRAIAQRLHYDAGRVEDEDIGAAHALVRQAVGPAGSGCFVDTCRCLHYGSRQNRNERLVLVLKYVSFYAPEGRPDPWADIAAALPRPLDRLERLVLGLR